MELSVRRLNNSLSTNKERLHAHSQVHTQTPKKEKKNKAKKQKKQNKQNKQTPNPIMETDCQNSLFYLLSLSLFLS